MVNGLLLELVERSLIHLSSRELRALLLLVEVELRNRADVCSANHVARAIASHLQWLAEHPSREVSTARKLADSEGADPR